MASAGQLSSSGRLPETFVEQGPTAAAAGRQHPSGLTTAWPHLLGSGGLPTPFGAAGLAGADSAATSSPPQVAQSQNAVAKAAHLPRGSTLADHIVNERHVQPKSPSSSLGPVLAGGWLQGLGPAASAAASLPWLPPIDPQELEARQPGGTLTDGSAQGWQEVGGTQAAAAGSSAQGRQPGSAESGHNAPVPLSALLNRLPQPTPGHLGQEQRQTGMPQAQSRGMPCRDGAARPEGALPCPAATVTFSLLAAQQASCPACPACNPSSGHVFLWHP